MVRALLSGAIYGRLASVMACLTPLPFDDCRALLDRYGFELSGMTALAAGSVNSNFLLETKEGVPLFARIYEEQGPAGATFEIELNEALAAAGIAVARPLRPRTGEAHLTAASKPFALYHRVEGEVLCQRRVSSAAVASVGAALADVHRADLGGLVVPEGRFGFPQIEQRLQIVAESGRAELQDAAKELRSWSRSLAEERSAALPCGLIHGDLFRDNVLVATGAQGAAPAVSALLDFESASNGPFVYDLMVTLLAWCYGEQLEPALARAMVEAYHARRPLSAPEQAEMVREGSIACLRFATTRLTDFSLRTPPGQEPARDYRRFRERRAALVSGALDRALQGVF